MQRQPLQELIDNLEAVVQNGGVAPMETDQVKAPQQVATVKAVNSAAATTKTCSNAAGTTALPEAEGVVLPAAASQAAGAAAPAAAAAPDPSSTTGAWKQMLWDALHATAPPAKFAHSGSLEHLAPFLCPDITVNGVGRLGLPLTPEQAVALKTATEQAPHGKGLQTVVDTAVRDAHQIDAAQVSISSSWDRLLQHAVTEVSNALGLSDNGIVNIDARLYKLLLYEQGGHFRSHQDTEKERGMIGTLVVQLPCAQGHTGGQLTVRHKGKSHTYNFAEGSERSLQYAAFFADCEHELSPITSGMRLVLVYNLVWVGAPGTAPRLLTKSPAEEQLQQALQAWEAELAAGDHRKRIAILLEHHYTDANLRFEHLKGADRSLARALSTCSGLDAHLVLVTRTISGGTDDYSYDKQEWHKRQKWTREEGGGRGPPHHIQAGFVYNDVIKTGRWIARNGAAIDYGAIDPKQDFFDPEGKPLFGKNDIPDEEEYEGYTGNTGPEIDHIYRRALLVLWPRSQALVNAQRAGFAAVLAILTARTQQCAARHQVQLQHVTHGVTGAHTGAASAVRSTSAADMLAALQACMELLERPPAAAEAAKPSWSSCRFSSGCSGSTSAPSKSQNITAVLQQGVLAVQLGAQGADDVLQRLLALTVSSQVGLGDGVLAQALVAAALTLDATAAGPPLQQLVSSCMASHPSSCLTLIKGVSSKPQLQQQLAAAALAAVQVSAATVDNFVLLALAVPDLPVVQQEAVEKLVAAVQADSSASVAVAVAASLHKLALWAGLQHQLAVAVVAAVTAAGPAAHLASCVPVLQALQQHPEQRKEFAGAVLTSMRSGTVTWQVSTAVLLSAAVQDDQALHQMLRAAVAESVFTNSSLLAAQADESMLLLSCMLLSEKKLMAAYYDHFAAAVTKKAGNYALLKLLLQSAEVKAALSLPEVQQLVACQLSNLEQMSAVPPFSWNMPQAKFPHNAQVEAFLQSPRQTFTLHGYDGIKRARSAASSLSGCSYAYRSGIGSNNSKTYSFTATASGTGKNACVVITKTQDWWQQQLKEKEGLKQELVAVQALRR